MSEHMVCEVRECPGYGTLHPPLPVPKVMTTDELIAAMLDAATDTEANTLDDLLVRCGYWWQCETCKAYNVATSATCEVCGHGREEVTA